MAYIIADETIYFAERRACPAGHSGELSRTANSRASAKAHNISDTELFPFFSSRSQLPGVVEPVRNPNTVLNLKRRNQRRKVAQYLDRASVGKFGKRHSLDVSEGSVYVMTCP